MERWTKRTADGVLLSEDREEKYTPIELIDILLGLLADYEDTGLTPEYIRELLADAHAMHNELKRYKDAEKDGRLVVLPCKAGDTVYQIDFGYNEKETVRGYSVYMHTNLYNFRPSSIGKTVFFTHEEAEKALKGFEEVRGDA